MYFYHDGAQEVGPFSRERLEALAQGELIGAGTLIRSRDSEDWVPFESLSLKTRNPQSAESTNASEQMIEATEAPKASTTQDSKRIEDVAHAQVRADNTAHEPNDPSVLDSLPESSQNASVTAGSAVSDTADSFESNVDARETSLNGWKLGPPTPWRRYGARILDTTVNGFAAFILVAIGFYAIAPATADQVFSAFEGPAGPLLDTIATTLVAALVGGALIGTTGFTLGKWVFGIKVTGEGGRKIGIGAGIARDIEVWLKGMGAGIPIVALVTMLVAYNRLTTKKQTSWDEGRYKVWSRPSGTGQTLLNIVGIALIIVVVGGASALAGL